MNKIYVESSEVEAIALKMEEANQQYQNNCIALFRTVEDLKNAWAGKDNVAFSMQIQKYEADFKELSVLCTQYSEFLKRSSIAYQELQENLASQINHLR